MRKPIYAAPALIWSALILTASVWPAGQIPRVNLLNADKLFHALVFLGLTICWVYAFRKWGVPRFRSLLYGAFFSTLYGVLMEAVQGLFIPRRMFDVLDMLANTTGCLVAVLLWWLLVPARFPSPSRP